MFDTELVEQAHASPFVRAQFIDQTFTEIISYCGLGGFPFVAQTTFGCFCGGQGAQVLESVVAGLGQGGCQGLDGFNRG